MYHKLSYLAARAALSRYVAKTLERPECNVFRKAEFQRSNVVLDGTLKQKKAEGNEPSVEHKESMHKSDLAKLALYFHDVLEEGNAVKLTQYCWFNISSFCVAWSRSTDSSQEGGHRLRHRQRGQGVCNVTTRLFVEELSWRRRRTGVRNMRKVARPTPSSSS